MPQGQTFTTEAAERIARAVRWVEGQIARPARRGVVRSGVANVVSLRLVGSTPDGDGNYDAVITVLDPEAGTYTDAEAVKVKDANGTALASGDHVLARPAGYTSGGDFLYLCGEGVGVHITVREVDGTPSVTATVLEVLQGFGLRISDEGGGVARLILDDATHTTPGGTSTGTQEFGGTKIFDAVQMYPTGVAAGPTLSAGSNHGNDDDKTWALVSGDTPEESTLELGMVWLSGVYPTGGVRMYDGTDTWGITTGGSGFQLIDAATGAQSANLTCNDVTSNGVVSAAIYAQAGYYKAYNGSGYSTGASATVSGLVFVGGIYVSGSFSGGTGTVTSVGLSVPSILSVSGSPVTGSGTLTVTLATQTANAVFAGPTMGGAATPAFRALVAADIPSHNHSAADITSGTLAVGRGGTGVTSTGGDGSVLIASSGVWVAAQITGSGLAVLTNGGGTINVGVAAATQAEQEAASSTTVAVTPGRQKYHPCAAKGWVSLDGTGTIAIQASYNVSGITDNGTGDYTVTWDVDFSSAEYCVSGITRFADSSTGDTHVCVVNSTTSQAAGSCRVGSVGNNGAFFDCKRLYLAAWGDQ